MAYYRFILDYGVSKFRRYAVNVWGVSPEGKSDKEIAEEGLSRMENWMKELGLTMRLGELGVTADMLPAVAQSTLVMQGGYKVLNRADILAVLKASL